MIYVSTGGEPKHSAIETALRYFKSGINYVELSGGAFSPTYEADLKALPNNMYLQVHNYYPPSKIPFVLNLASANPLVSKKSISHVRRAIRLAVMLDCPTYSFHAGFCIDPDVRELGNQLGRHSLLARDHALQLFGDRLADLAEEARREGVTLLVENNVINKKNLDIFEDDPLLLTHPDEISWFMERSPSNVGLLLDVGHLKVSATAKSFDMVQAHEKIKGWIKGYHFSENDGTADTNDPVTANSWFWKYIVRGLSYYSLEVYNQQISTLTDQVDLAQTMLFSTIN